MAHYVVLGNFTDQGIRAIKETSKRAKALRELAKSQGAAIKEIYWTIGAYDLVFTIDSAGDEVMAALMMKLGSLGNIKTQTLRAFGEAEIEGVLSKI